MKKSFFLKYDERVVKTMQPILTKISLVVTIFACIVVFTSCYKDKGNYTYHTINDISIVLPDTIVANVGAPFQLTPILNQTVKSDSSTLKYEWDVFASQIPGDTTIQVLATTRNLNITIPLPAQNSYYFMGYKVIDTSSGITYQKRMALLVATNYQIGWMLLEQGTQNADISFINTQQNKAYHNVYSSVNSTNPLPTSTFNIAVLNIPKSAAGSNATYPAQTITVALSANNGYLINFQTMEYQNVNYPALFLNPPSVIQPQYLALAKGQSGSQSYTDPITINAGKLYRRNLSLGQLLFQTAYTMDDGSDYYLAPFYVSGFYFDTIHHRFLQEANSSTVLQSMSYYSYYAYDPTNIPGKLLAFGGGVNFTAKKAIVYDLDEDSTILYEMQGSNPNFYRVMHNSPGIETSSSFLFPIARNQIYYAIRNTIYMYDISADNATAVYNFPSGENITTMALQDDYDLVAATYNGSGSVYFFSLNALGILGNNNYANSYTGFGKILNIVTPGSIQ